MQRYDYFTDCDKVAVKIFLKCDIKNWELIALKWFLELIYILIGISILGYRAGFFLNMC